MRRAAQATVICACDRWSKTRTMHPTHRTYSRRCVDGRAAPTAHAPPPARHAPRPRLLPGRRLEEEEWKVLVASAKADTTKVREKQREVLIAEAAKKGFK